MLDIRQVHGKQMRRRRAQGGLVASRVACFPAVMQKCFCCQVARRVGCSGVKLRHSMSRSSWGRGRHMGPSSGAWASSQSAAWPAWSRLHDACTLDRPEHPSLNTESLPLRMGRFATRMSPPSHLSEVFPPPHRACEGFAIVHAMASDPFVIRAGIAVRHPCRQAMISKT
jgi:hypothetical protein